MRHFIVILFTLASACYLLPTALFAQSTSDWYMSGANPQRTSHVDAPGGANLSNQIKWYRSLESYIPAHVQIIAVDNRFYISTADGLLVFNADTGHLIWRFDTQLPLGNSPTVYQNFVYVAGYGKKVYILPANVTETSQTQTISPLTSYDLANAGYDTNPLVITRNSQTWVYIGDRAGVMHAFTFNGSSVTPRWTRAIANSGIHFSAAYNQNLDRIYFAANDNFAYSLDAQTGTNLTRSNSTAVSGEAKLPGYGFYSWYPVIDTASNSIIYSKGTMYRTERAGSPSEADLNNSFGLGYDLGADFSNLFTSDNGSQTISNPDSIISYFNNQPHRRSMMALDLNTLVEKKFSDGQNGTMFLPISFAGTKNGQRYPPVIGSDGRYYATTMWKNDHDAKGKLVGWSPNQPRQYQWYSTTTAVTEPASFSSAGNYIFKQHCCGRIADGVNISGSGGITFWSYSIDNVVPNFNQTWYVEFNTLSGLRGWYEGVRDFHPRYDDDKYKTVNSFYHTHGDQNALVYHQGKVVSHRLNAIIVSGSGASYGQLPTVLKATPQTQAKSLSTSTITQQLETQIQAMVDAGQLRPGYSMAKVGNYNDLDNYFENPGDTIYSLSLAYPYLTSSTLKAQTRDYLYETYQRYFQNNVYTSTGWANLAQREGMPMPTDLNISAGPGNTRTPHPENAYALYLYAKNVLPEENRVSVEDLYQKSRSLVPTTAVTISDQFVFDYNKYMTAYIGYLNLQAMTSHTDNRTTIQSRLSSMQSARITNFDKDSIFLDPNFYRYYNRALDHARHFMYLNPDLGQWYRQNLLSQVNQAMEEYAYVGPYWFAHQHNAWLGEATFQPLYTAQAMFQAKAWIQGASPSELSKYLDSPAFEVGDLFYIQNLVAVLDADPNYTPPPTQPPTSATPTPVYSVDNDTDTDILDILRLIFKFGQPFAAGDFNGNGVIDIFDVNTLISNL